MTFTSVLYFLFLACTLPLYYLLPFKYRNYFLIAISVLFYLYAEVEYLFLIILIIIVNFFIGIQIDNTESKKKQRLYLNISLFANIGILAFFKYWNFIVENIFSFFGLFPVNNRSIPIFEIALPLGISYYTFQMIGYTLDVYRGSQKAEKNFFHFSLFTLFFPKLLVGPIERAHRFLPQLKRNIYFNKVNIVEGGRRIVWGLFKKLVVADRISIYENVIMSHRHEQSGSTLLFATLLYTFQIYADFSGYTDIAIGTARLFGFNLMENFKRPLLAKNMSDFWRRWHISLSSWVNDYIFNVTALKHRRWGKWGVFYALLMSFTVIGIWHGASWNYVLFGILQAVALIYETITRRVRKRISKKVPSFIYTNLSILLTFLYVSFSLIIFRTNTFAEAADFISSIFTNSGTLFYSKPSTLLFIITGVGTMMIYDLQEEFKRTRISHLLTQNWVAQNFSYALLLIYILLAGVFDGGQFIYFAF